MLCDEPVYVKLWSRNRRCSELDCLVSASHRSEGRKPREDVFVGFPACWGGVGLGDQMADGLEGFLFHFEVDIDVLVGGFDGGVTEPVGDHGEINVGLEEVEGGAVPPGVGCDSSGEKGWTNFGGCGDSVGDDVTDAEAGEAIAMDIEEEGLRVGRGCGAGLDIAFQGVDGLTP